MKKYHVFVYAEVDADNKEAAVEKLSDYLLYPSECGVDIPSCIVTVTNDKKLEVIE